MMRTSPQYKYDKDNVVNHPKHLTITGKLAKQDDDLKSSEESKFSVRDKLNSQSDQDSIRMLRDNALTTKK